jgi:hypothetical protein
MSGAATQVSSRRQHLLALAVDAERKADRHFLDRSYEKGETFQKLAKAYRAMAAAEDSCRTTRAG